MNQDYQRPLLWLMECVGPAAQHTVLPWISDPEFFDYSESVWRDRGLSESDAKRLADRKGRESLDATLEKLVSMNVRIISADSDAFPYSLETTRFLPPILAIQGAGHAWQRDGLAVVGSRKPSAYGRETAFAIGREAALRGVPVVSGAAAGIDTAAHTGVLDTGGTTIAVLGFGHFHCYPKSSRALLDRISENGAVVSQFAPGRSPDRKNFPIRNAVIAALSSAVVVVEGTAGSGARHTAGYARKMQVPLFAVPGEITRPTAQLPNRLLAEGAAPVTSPADPVDPMLRCITSRTKPVVSTGRRKKERSALPELTDPLARRLYEQIQLGKQTLDELLTETEAAHGDVAMVLIDLELKGYIRQEPGPRYVLSGP